MLGVRIVVMVLGRYLVSEYVHPSGHRYSTSGSNSPAIFAVRPSHSGVTTATLPIGPSTYIVHT